jgi:hypothetical protein
MEMTKEEMISWISSQTGLGKGQCEHLINKVFKYAHSKPEFDQYKSGSVKDTSVKNKMENKIDKKFLIEFRKIFFSGYKITNNYTLADLLWEATKRNMNYKREFWEASENYFKDQENVKILYDIFSDLPPNFAIQRIPGDASKWEKWGILMGDISKYTEKIIRFIWLSPAITTDELHEYMNNKNLNPFNVHPYHFFCETQKTSEDDYYHSELYEFLDPSKYSKFMTCPIQAPIGFYPYIFECKDNNDIFICAHKTIIGNKVLFLFNPMDSDAKIINTLKNIKKKILTNTRKKVEHYKAAGGITVYQRDINKYIKWLRMYDGILFLYKSKNGKTNLAEENGAIVLPKGFDRKILNPATMAHKKYIRVKKRILDAYNGAVHFIQSTPNIVFSPSRSSPSPKRKPKKQK